MTESKLELTSETTQQNDGDAMNVPVAERKGIRWNLLRLIKRLFFNRCFVMLILPSFGLLAIWIHQIEPNRIMLRLEVISCKDLRSKPLKRKLRIMHISDLHITSEKALLRFQDAVEKGLQFSPDLVFITGDTCIPVDKKERVDEKMLTVADAYFATLRRAVPTFACLGNHDYITRTDKHDMRIVNMLKRSGIELLVNGKKELIVNGSKIVIAGLSDYESQRIKPAACLEKRSDNAERPFTILMSHNHDSLFAIDDYEWDLMLSGHTHGGQFRFPFTRWCPFAPVVHMEYAAKGLYALKDSRWLSVTSGVGNYMEIRFNCFPEVTIIDIEP